MFPLGGHLLIAKDFKGPDFTDDEVRESFGTKVKKTGQALARSPVVLGNLLRRRRTPTFDQADVDLEKVVEKATAEVLQEATVSELKYNTTPAPTLIGEPIESRTASRIGLKLTKQVTFRSDEESLPNEEIGLQYPSATPTIFSAKSAAPEDERSPSDDSKIDPSPTAAPSIVESGLGGPPYPPSRGRQIWNLVKTFNTPPTISIFISFPIALIPQLKDLFVTMPNSPRGPDGLAPLAFVMDTANFIGAASVPLGLVCLGSALASLSVPKPWTRLPLGAIGMFTIAKLFLMPIFGVLLCKLFTTLIPIIDVNDKVLRFVCM